jgi:hypothetical protein
MLPTADETSIPRVHLYWPHLSTPGSPIAAGSGVSHAPSGNTLASCAATLAWRYRTGLPHEVRWCFDRRYHLQMGFAAWKMEEVSEGLPLPPALILTSVIIERLNMKYRG